MEKNKYNYKRLAVSIIYLILSVLVLSLIIDEMISYNGPTWFYHPVSEAEKKIANVSAFSLLSYFTYLTMVIYAIWGIGAFYCCISQSKTLKKAILNDYVILTVTIFCVMTFLFYVCLQMFSPIPFGFTGTSPSQIKSFLVGILMHVIIPLSMLIYYLFIQTPKSVNWKKSLWINLFVLAYVVVVKLVGKFGYNIEWYPYVVFTPKGLWQTLFKGAQFNGALMTVIYIVLGILFFIGVSLIIFLLCKYATRKAQKGAVDKKSKRSLSAF